MARSMTGGTRGFIRGKVANDLYQVTRNASGKKVQIVRAVEESRRYSNTEIQAMARMNMALCMGSLSQFKEIVDHSFQGVPYGQLSIAHFVHTNMPLIQADERAHWEGDNVFDYPFKGDNSIRAGEWIMAQGSLEIPQGLSVHSDNADYNPTYLAIITNKRNALFGDIKRVLGANAGDYITILVFAVTSPSSFNRLLYRRIFLADNISDNTLITETNVSSMFRYEGNTGGITRYYPTQGVVQFSVGTITPQAHLTVTHTCLILSKWNGRVWQRNNAQFQIAHSHIQTSDYLQRPMDVFEDWYPDWDGNNPFE